MKLKYDLYAVLVHDGSPYSGHYYCFVRSSPTAWYQMNDSEASVVPIFYLLLGYAYESNDSMSVAGDQSF